MANAIIFYSSLSQNNDFTCHGRRPACEEKINFFLKLKQIEILHYDTKQMLSSYGDPEDNYI